MKGCCMANSSERVSPKSWLGKVTGSVFGTATGGSGRRLWDGQPRYLPWPWDGTPVHWIQSPFHGKLLSLWAHW